MIKVWPNLLQAFILGTLITEAAMARSPASVKRRLPHIPSIAEKYFPTCFKDPSEEIPSEDLQALQKDENSTDSATVNSQGFTLRCPLKEFLKNARERHEGNVPVRYFVGKVILKEIQRLRVDTFLTTQIQNFQKSVLTPATPLVPRESFIYLRDLPVDLQSFENPSGLFLAQNDELVDEARFWLEGLFVDSPLKMEAQLLWAEILGESQRIPSLLQFLDQEQWLDWPKWARNSILYKLDYWTESYSDAHLRQWFQKKIETLRPIELTAGRAEDFFLWTRSFELAPLHVGPSERAFRLEKLKVLHALFPGAANQRKIQELYQRFNASKLFKPVNLDELSSTQALARAAALVKNVDSEEALKILTTLRVKRRSFKDDEELWKALQLHVRILRILDRRGEIPAVITAYLKIRNFLAAPASKTMAPKMNERALEISKLYWTYDSPEKALAVMEKIQRYAKKFGDDINRGQAAYLKVRILEQKEDKSQALLAVDEALGLKQVADVALDLQWRKFLLIFDQAPASRSIADLTAAIEKIRPNLSDAGERGRLAYWKGRVYELNEKKEEAKNFFNEAFDADPFSYYSNLAGLELRRLGESPKLWNLPESKDYSEPKWSHFFTEEGRVLDPAFKELARAYFLARVGESASAARSFPEMDRVLWSRVLSSQVSEADRLNFGRAVAWLRLSLGDNVGSLRAAEALRQGFGHRLEGVDFAYLYPLLYWDQIDLQAKIQGIDAWFVASLIRQESAFNPKARSWANALGLMQMIPPVAREEARLLGKKDFNYNELYKVPVAVELGTAHLKRNLRSFSDSWICAIASYNAGSPPVRRWQSYYPDISPLSFVERISYTETRNYVKSILRNYLNYQRVYAKGDVNPDFLFRLPELKAAKRE